MAKPAIEIPLNSSITKRVAALYRVSTKKQLDPSENGGDISTQQHACQVFIQSKPGWTLVNEYYEKGVSGYKKKSADRDVIQQVLYDAEQGKMDMLLVYMFDRLGRREDDTPLILQTLVGHGVEVWSVTEGQQRFDGHVDKLLNYIRFWQASGESYKTSIRVNEAHRQMVEAGRFRGGAIPYGYQTKPSGKFSKKGKELLELVIDPEQAEVVREIYRLVVEEGYGQNRIADLLNHKGIKTQKGNSWRSSAINALVKNPIYKGYLVYARGTDTAVLSKEKQEALVMVEEATWQRAQEIRALRNAVNTKKEEQTVVIRSTKGSLLLIGMVRCGHCGSPLTSTWNKKIYQRSDGTTRYSRYAKYRCSGKALKNMDCKGKTVHSQFKLESLVVSEVYAYLDRLATVDLTAQIEKMKKSHDGQEERVLQKWAKQLQGEREKLAKYKAEVIKVISGESQFSSQTLNDLIEETKRNIDEVEEKRQVLQEVMERQKVEKVELEAVKTYVPVWREVFENASNEKKKMMLSTIIGSIQVYREKIEMEFKLHINQFLGTMGDGTVRDGKLLTSHANVVNA